MDLHGTQESVPDHPAELVLRRVDERQLQRALVRLMLK